MFCQHCGTQVPPNAKECPNCHAPVAAAAVPPTQPFSTPVVPTGGQPAPAQRTAIPQQPANTAPMYTVPPQYQAPAAAPAAPQKTKKPYMIVVIIAAALIVLCLLAAVAVMLLKPDLLPFDLPSLGGGGKGKESTDLLVAYPKSNGEQDVNWVHGKNDDLIFEDVPGDYNFNVMYTIKNGEIDKYLWSKVGFIPGDPNQVYAFTMDDDETVLMVRNLKKETDTTLFQSSFSFTTYLLENGSFLILENRSESMRVYLSDGSGEAERILKADNVNYLPEMDRLMGTELDDENQTFTLFDLKGEEVLTLYDGEPFSNWIFSGDGSILAGVRNTDDGQEVVLISTKDGEEISVNDSYKAVPTLSTGSKGSVIFFFGENEDGMLNLEATTNGEWTLLEENARALAAIVNPDAAQLAYQVIDEDGASLVKVADIASGESEEIFSSDETVTLYAETKETDAFYLTEVDEDLVTTLYRCSYRGGGPQEMFQEENVSFYGLSSYQEILYTTLYSSETNSNSLWVKPPRADEGFLLLEDWYSISTAALSDDGSRMIFYGMEEMDDDVELYMIDIEEDAEPVSLDDDLDSVWNTFLSQDEKSLYYTANIGSNEDDYEVRQISLAKEGETPVVLYEEAILLSTGWSTASMEDFWYAYSVYTTQSSGVSRLKEGVSIDGSLSAEVTEARYSVNLQADAIYRIEVQANDTFNPSISLYDETGMWIKTRNDQWEQSEFMIYTPQTSGSFQVGISDYDYSGKDLDFSVKLVALPTKVISLGETVYGELTVEDKYTMNGQDFYTDYYLLDAKMNDNLLFEMSGMPEAPGSLFLMNNFNEYQSGTYVTEGSYGSFYYYFYSDGRYIVAVGDDSVYYGLQWNAGDDHSYNFTVSK